MKRTLLTVLIAMLTFVSVVVAEKKKDTPDSRARQAAAQKRLEEVASVPPIRVISFIYRNQWDEMRSHEIKTTLPSTAILHIGIYKRNGQECQFDQPLAVWCSTSRLIHPSRWPEYDGDVMFVIRHVDVDINPVKTTPVFTQPLQLVRPLKH